MHGVGPGPVPEPRQWRKQGRKPFDALSLTTQASSPCRKASAAAVLPAEPACLLDPEVPESRCQKARHTAGRRPWLEVFAMRVALYARARRFFPAAPWCPARGPMRDP